MYDQSLFLGALSRFAVVLPACYDLEATLAELTESVAAVLGLTGCGVTMAEGGRLRFVAGVGEASRELERNQEEQQSGPGQEAYDTGEVVRVSDVRVESSRWSEFSAAATRLVVAGVAVIPMRLGDHVMGVLSLYGPEPREWSDQDIAVAVVLADMATSYVVKASQLRQQQQLSEQFQEVLDSCVVIEQAKGITASRHAVSVDQAYQRMRRHASINNASLRTVAEAIVAVGLQV